MFFGFEQSKFIVKICHLPLHVKNMAYRIWVFVNGIIEDRITAHGFET